MKKLLLNYITCPVCKHRLNVKINETKNTEIKEGSLICKKCNKTYKITNYVPRFVDTDKYVDSFSLEWNKHRTTQLDSVNKTNESETAFFQKTGLKKEELKNKLILDVGCGTGRFMEIAAKYGAKVVGIDLSYAVDAAFKNMGLKRNIHIIQADIFNLPFKRGNFDLIYSIGVLHHTPDTKKAFKQLVPLLKKNGKIAIWVYDFYVHRPHFMSEIYRKITSRLPKKLLYYLTFLSVIYYYLTIIPLIGHFFFALFPISPERNWRWRWLDTFDWYSPKYQWKHTNGEVFEWFKEAGLKDIEVFDPPVSIKGSK